MPEYLQGLLQERMESQDWRLHELALCAAAISQVIQEEVMADLRFVFSTVLQFSTTSDLNEFEYGQVVSRCASAAWGAPPPACLALCRRPSRRDLPALLV